MRELPRRLTRRWVLRHRCRGVTRVDARIAARFALEPTNPGVIEYCSACDGWFPRTQFRLEKLEAAP